MSHHVVFRGIDFFGDSSFWGYRIFWNIAIFGDSSFSTNRVFRSFNFFGASSFSGYRVLWDIAFFGDSSFSTNQVFRVFNFFRSIEFRVVKFFGVSNFLGNRVFRSIEFWKVWLLRKLLFKVPICQMSHHALSDRDRQISLPVWPVRIRDVAATLLMIFLTIWNITLLRLELTMLEFPKLSPSYPKKLPKLFQLWFWTMLEVQWWKV